MSHRNDGGRGDEGGGNSRGKKTQRGEPGIAIESEVADCRAWAARDMTRAEEINGLELMGIGGRSPPPPYLDDGGAKNQTQCGEIA
jgi:hypothetical protein